MLSRRSQLLVVTGQEIASGVAMIRAWGRKLPASHLHGEEVRYCSGTKDDITQYSRHYSVWSFCVPGGARFIQLLPNIPCVCKMVHRGDVLTTRSINLASTGVLISASFLGVQSSHCVSLFFFFFFWTRVLSFVGTKRPRERHTLTHQPLVPDTINIREKLHQRT